MADKSKLRKNGGEGTKVGNFLRSINFKDVAKVVGSVATGNIAQAVSVLAHSGDLSPQEFELALKELEQDIVEQQETTKRWVSDNATDSWMTRNIRPYTLAFLTASLFIYIILDSSLEGFKIGPEWISLLKGLMMLAYGGYFGVRSAEKIFKKDKDA